jgi:ribonuclease VapC
MVIDTSAMVAILLGEPEAALYLAAIADAPERSMTAVAMVEIAIVAASRGHAGRLVVERMTGRMGIAVRPVDAVLTGLACDAYERFGKGRHPARLNFGDCFSYALAQSLGQPLLFKGDDFSRTNVPSAIG